MARKRQYTAWAACFGYCCGVVTTQLRCNHHIWQHSQGGFTVLSPRWQAIQSASQRDIVPECSFHSKAFLGGYIGTQFVSRHSVIGGQQTFSIFHYDPRRGARCMESYSIRFYWLSGSGEERTAKGIADKGRL